MFSAETGDWYLDNVFTKKANGVALFFIRCTSVEIRTSIEKLPLIMNISVSVYIEKDHHTRKLIVRCVHT